jgi:ribosome-binding ATPase
MSIRAGLVGLPNVGKSTLFNALTKSSVPAENYPFCTIDPHMAITNVPDIRTEKLKALYKSGEIIPATVQFVDIAGLVKGAASGEGLGNQFLSHIREVDLILHVLRCFEDPNITSVRDALDPLVDLEIINTELMLKDAESIEKRKQKIAQLQKQNKSNAQALKELTEEAALLDLLDKAINAHNLTEIRNLVKNSTVQTIPLLSAKNFLIIANLAEAEMSDDIFTKNIYYQKLVTTFGQDRVVPVSAKLEYDLSQLADAEQQEMMDMLGLSKRGLPDIISKTYKNLGLITFFTCGPKEIHAWPVKAGITIRKAAGEIHSDLEKGFICAEIFNCEDLFTYGSEAKLKEVGKLKTEGQDYIVKDGDIVLIKFNV